MNSDEPLRHPGSGEPIPAREQPGYYAGFSTLAQQSHWDQATRALIRKRVESVPPIRFFSPAEAQLMELLAGHLVPQDDRLPARRIPIVPRIDERLFAGRTPGYRFESMPPDEEAYRLGLVALEQMAQRSFGRTFAALGWREQEELLKSVHDAEPRPGAEPIWARMPPHRYWALVLGDCLEAYYAHPWAWDEIGFGGPAYPRAYTRLERGDPEPWERDEQRYAWEAPVNTLSDPKDPEIAAHREHPPQGQGGTH